MISYDRLDEQERAEREARLAWNRTVFHLRDELRRWKVLALALAAAGMAAFLWALSLWGAR